MVLIFNIIATATFTGFNCEVLCVELVLHCFYRFTIESLQTLGYGRLWVVHPQLITKLRHIVIALNEPKMINHAFHL